MNSEDLERRIKCADTLKTLGINPYPAVSIYKPTMPSVYDISKESLKPLPEAQENEEKELFVVAGRIILFRCMGKTTFITLQDSHHKRIQIMCLKGSFEIKNLVSTEEYSKQKVLTKLIDIGDFIAVEGFLFNTKKKEKTLYAKTIEITCKSLLPLPDKHFGLKNQDTIFRKRWLDMISNKQSFDVLMTRSKILHNIRAFMHQNSFTEVELPVMQKVYGGAQANPFTTYCKDLKKDLFLRIALELPLKELIIGGIDRVYEMGKVFRNESVDRTHNPEFTALEAYAVYWDYNDVMSYISSMIHHVCEKTLGTHIIETSHIKTQKPVIIKFEKQWTSKKMSDIVSEELNIDICTCSKEDLFISLDHIISQERAQEINLITMSKGQLLLAAFEELCEEKIVQPTHVIDYPIESTPLCKVSENQYIKDVVIIERFESFVMGTEICNAYSELNDPMMQEELINKAASLSKQSEEFNPVDKDFISAIYQGMPPTGGFGLGVDRLIMILTKSNAISNVIFFPMML